MENISRTPLRERDVHYYRQRQKNRVFSGLVKFFADEAERTGVRKVDIANKLACDPALVTRWLAAPSNMTLDTISDLLLALDAEIDYQIVRFQDRAIPNAMHPLVATALNVRPPSSSFSLSSTSPSPIAEIGTESETESSSKSVLVTPA